MKYKYKKKTLEAHEKRGSPAQELFDVDKS